MLGRDVNKQDIFEAGIMTALESQAQKTLHKQRFSTGREGLAGSKAPALPGCVFQTAAQLSPAANAGLAGPDKLGCGLLCDKTQAACENTAGLQTARTALEPIMWSGRLRESMVMAQA